jgi:hypothetical protein
MYNKVEAQILLWGNHLLSIGGRFTFIKYVLENILVYWTCIVVVPKGVPTMIKKIACFCFIWEGG